MKTFLPRPQYEESIRKCPLSVFNTDGTSDITNYPTKDGYLALWDNSEEKIIWAKIIEKSDIRWGWIIEVEPNNYWQRVFDKGAALV